MHNVWEWSAWSLVWLLNFLAEDFIVFIFVKGILKLNLKYRNAIRTVKIIFEGETAITLRTLNLRVKNLLLLKIPLKNIIYHWTV